MSKKYNNTVLNFPKCQIINFFSGNSQNSSGKFLHTKNVVNVREKKLRFIIVFFIDTMPVVVKTTPAVKIVFAAKHIFLILEAAFKL